MKTLNNFRAWVRNLLNKAIDNALAGVSRFLNESLDRQLLADGAYEDSETCLAYDDALHWYPEVSAQDNAWPDVNAGDNK